MIDRIVFKNSQLDIDIQKALTVYRVESAMGKSYLPYFISRINTPFSIRTYTNQEDYRRFIETPWLEGDDVVYFFDRFDLLYNDAILDILAKSQGRCVLLDLKDVMCLMARDIKFICAYMERPDVRRIIVRNGSLYRR